MPFEITVAEKHVDENVTGSSVGADLEAAMKAAHALHVYDQVMSDEEPSGWSAEEKALAAAGCEAAKVLVAALGKKSDHYRVTVHVGDDHVNVHVQNTGEGSVPQPASEES